MSLRELQRIYRLPTGSFFLFGLRGVGKSTWIRSQLPHAHRFDLLDEGLYQELLGELGSLAGDATLSSDALREQLVALLQARRARRPRMRAEIVRDRLIEGVRPVRALLKALAALPWKASKSCISCMGCTNGTCECYRPPAQCRWVASGAKRSAARIASEPSLPQR